MLNHRYRSNCRIGKIGCYHIALYRLSSRVGDKRTRTADIRHRVNHRLSGPRLILPERPTVGNNSPPNTAYNFHRTVLSKEQLFSKSQKVLSWNPILTKDSCGSGGSSYRRTGNGELSPPFSTDSLVLRMLVLRMSDCPSPTLTVQPESGQLTRSTY